MSGGLGRFARSSASGSLQREAGDTIHIAGDPDIVANAHGRRGPLFGLLRALIIVLAAAIAAGFTSLPRKEVWKDSLSGAQLAAAASAIKPWLPPAFAQRMKYN